MGIEPTSEAWEASILPLYDARSEYKLANPPRLGKSVPRFKAITAQAIIWRWQIVWGSFHLKANH